MVERGRRKRSNSNPDGKVGPGGRLHFLSSLSGRWGRPSSPLAAQVSFGRGWGVSKNLLPSGDNLPDRPPSWPLLPSSHFTAEYKSRTVCFEGLRVVRGGQGGQRQRGRGQGQWPFSAVPGKQGLSPKHPAQGSVTALATCPPKGVPNPGGVPQSGEGSGKEDHKDDEEDNEDKEDFDHEPPV